MRKKVKLFFLSGMSFQQFRPAKSENKFPKVKSVRNCTGRFLTMPLMMCCNSGDYAEPVFEEKRRILFLKTPKSFYENVETFFKSPRPFFRIRNVRLHDVPFRAFQAFPVSVWHRSICNRGLQTHVRHGDSEGSGVSPVFYVRLPW